MSGLIYWALETISIYILHPFIAAIKVIFVEPIEGCYRNECDRLVAIIHNIIWWRWSLLDDWQTITGKQWAMEKEIRDDMPNL